MVSFLLLVLKETIHNNFVQVKCSHEFMIIHYIGGKESQLICLGMFLSSAMVIVVGYNNKCFLRSGSSVIYNIFVWLSSCSLINYNPFLFIGI